METYDDVIYNILMLKLFLNNVTFNRKLMLVTCPKTTFVLWLFYDVVWIRPLDNYYCLAFKWHKWKNLYQSKFWLTEIVISQMRWLMIFLVSQSGGLGVGLDAHWLKWGKWPSHWRNTLSDQYYWQITMDITWWQNQDPKKEDSGYEKRYKMQTPYRP